MPAHCSSPVIATRCGSFVAAYRYLLGIAVWGVRRGSLSGNVGNGSNARADDVERQLSAITFAPIPARFAFSMWL
jgi:hypothetical protein